MRPEYRTPRPAAARRAIPDYACTPDGRLCDTVVFYKKV